MAEYGVFESFTLYLAVIMSAEFGFVYTTLLGYLLMTVAFSEMMQLQARY